MVTLTDLKRKGNESLKKKMGPSLIGLVWSEASGILEPLVKMIR